MQLCRRFLTCSLEESKLLGCFHLLSFICGKNLVCDDRDASSPADRFKGRWRMETAVSREKCLISLPSGRVRGHDAVIFICSTTSSSPPHQPGLLQSHAGALICVLGFWDRWLLTALQTLFSFLMNHLVVYLDVLYQVRYWSGMLMLSPGIFTQASEFIFLHFIFCVISFY